MEMIERVGRAIFASQDWHEFHPAYEHASEEVWEVAARAAIEALRKPTEDMTTAGRKTCITNREQSARIYTAMIDAALKESND